MCISLVALDYLSPNSTWARVAAVSPLMRTAVVLLRRSGNDGGIWGHRGDGSLTAATFPPLGSSITGTATLSPRPRHDLMDDLTEDSLGNGIIMVLWFDPHVRLGSNMARDASQSTYRADVFENNTLIQITCKCPAHTGQHIQAEALGA